MPTADREERPQSFGIWVETSPFQRLRGEGIYQLLVHILRAGTREPNTRFVIACAAWSVADLAKIMDEYQVQADSVDFVVSRRQAPILLRWLHAGPRGTSTKRIVRIPSVLKVIGTGVAEFLLRRTAAVLSSSYWWALALGVALWLLPLTAAIAPIVFVALPLWILRETIMVAIGYRDRISGRFGLRHLPKLTKPIGHRLRLAWRRGGDAIVNRMIRHEYDLLTRAILRRTDVVAWFIPSQSSHGPHASNVPLVVALPDVVYADFPAAFTSHGVREIQLRIRRLVHRAAAVIAYNEDVRQRHVIRHLKVAPSKTHVVRHAPMSVQMYLPPDLRRGNDAETRMALAEIIRRHFQTSGTRLIGNGRSDADYLKEFPFEQVRYLFVSSQIRPHKNLANLISAFDYLLRQRYLPLKLFTTGDLSHANQDVRDLIATRHLDLDVIGVPNLPAVVHAAFYRLAELTVVSTLFEGGLPFPFSESLSVGTPVVLSRIPAVCEALPRHLWPLALFDPYDTKSIADRIEWGLEHREILLVAETDEYASMTKRTWSHVAGEYLAVLRQTADSHAAFRPIRRPHWGSQSWQSARSFRPNSSSKPGN